MYTYIRIEVGLLGQAEGRQRGFWKRPSSSSSLCLWFVLSSSFIFFLFVHSLAPSTVLPPVFVIQRLPASQRLGQTVSVKKNDIPGVPPLFHFLLGSHVPLL